MADLFLLRTLFAIHQKFQEPSFSKVMDPFVLLAYASLATSRILLQQLLDCLNTELYFRFRRFILLVQKKWFLWTMAAAQAAENHGDEWGLIWYLWWGTSGFDNYHKIAVHDHVGVPKFYCTWHAWANTKKYISGIIPFT